MKLSPTYRYTWVQINTQPFTTVLFYLKIQLGTTSLNCPHDTCTVGYKYREQLSFIPESFLLLKEHTVCYATFGLHLCRIMLSFTTRRCSRLISSSASVILLKLRGVNSGGSVLSDVIPTR